MRIRFYLLLLMMAAAPAVRAQQDIQLVPRDEGFLPIGDAAIESAARIGDYALVVWGSVLADTTPEGTRNILRMQRFRGTGIAGEQTTVTGRDAMPYGSVRVVALRDRFVLLWNDRRSAAPGIYMQQVDSGGRLLGSEARFSARQVATTSRRGIMAGGSSADGYMIIWEESVAPHAAFARRIDPAGNPEGDEIALGDPLLEEVRTALLPGVTILRMKAQGDEELAAEGYMIRNGRLDRRRIPLTTLSGEDFHIGADTSTATLDGSSLTPLAGSISAPASKAGARSTAIRADGI
jgi:hypothetical protein